MEIDFLRIRAILDSKDLTQFIGADEGPEFEAKGAHAYDLTSPQGRFELAKDVSSFANSNGGCLVIGLRTERVPDKLLDRVSGLDEVDLSTFPRETYLGILKQLIFPNPSELSIESCPGLGGKDNGIVAICVPRQLEGEGPFVVLNAVADGERLKSFYVGLVQRDGAETTPLDAKALQSALRKGLSPFSQQLDRIEAIVSGLSISSGEGGLAREPDRIAERVRAILEATSE